MSKIKIIYTLILETLFLTFKYKEGKEIHITRPNLKDFTVGVAKKRVFMVRIKSTSAALVNRTMFYRWSTRRQLAHMLRRPSAANHAMLVSRCMFRALNGIERNGIWRVVAAQFSEAEKDGSSMRFYRCRQRYEMVRVHGIPEPLRMRVLMGIACFERSNEGHPHVLRKMKIVFYACANVRCVMVG